MRRQSPEARRPTAPREPGRDTPRPPRLAEALLRLVLPGGAVGASIRGDVRDEYVERVTAGSFSASAARRARRCLAARLWYWRQALGLVLHYSARRPRPVSARGGARMIEDLLQDLRYALRTLRSSPAFAVIATLVLALGIGATTALFSVVDAVLFRPLPYEEPDRLVRVTIAHQEQASGEGGGFSREDFADLTANNTTFESIAAYWFSPRAPMQVQIEGERQLLSAASVSADFFSMLGVASLRGRVIGEQDQVPGEDRVIVLSYAAWQGRFGGDPDVVGRTISVAGISTAGGPYTVVGVMPVSFRFPAPVPQVEAWTPISLITQATHGGGRENRWKQVVARLAEGAEAREATREVESLLARLARAYPETSDGWTRARVEPLRGSLVGPVRPGLLVLFAATGLILLTACANVASLLLARSAGRRREMALRASLGASGGRLVRQLLSEAVLMGTVGGVAGAALAVGAVRALLAVDPGLLPRVEEVGFDPRVAAFACGATLLSAVLFGLAPALGAARLRPGEALKEGGLTVTGRGRVRVSGLLPVAETAIAVVLAVGAGLLLRGFWELLHVEPGFRPEGVLSLELNIPAEVLRDPLSISPYQRDVLDTIQQVSGVVGAAGGKDVTLARSTEPYYVAAVGADGQPVGESFQPDVRIVTPGYFEVLGIPLVVGRTLEDTDHGVTVVNRSLARRLWGEEAEALGRRLAVGGRPFAVVGVVGDVHHGGLAQRTEPAAYMLDVHMPRATLQVFVRTAGDPSIIAPAVREAIRRAYPQQPVRNLAPLRQELAADVAEPRLFATLLAGFAGLALTLAALGVYGVVSYDVSRRTSELGVRQTLGARRVDLLRLVLKESLWRCATGVTLGLVGSLWLGQLLGAALYGVEPTDATAFVGVIVVVVATSLVASLVPALRAVRTDPLRALRGG